MAENMTRGYKALAIAILEGKSTEEALAEAEK